MPAVHTMYNVETNKQTMFTFGTNHACDEFCIAIITIKYQITNNVY